MGINGGSLTMNDHSQISGHTALGGGVIVLSGIYFCLRWESNIKGPWGEICSAIIP